MKTHSNPKLSSLLSIISILATLNTGTVLVAGGFTVVKRHYPFPPLTETNGLAELFTASTLTWKKANSLNQARALQTMTVLSNGQVLVASGETFDKNSQQLVPIASAELYTP